jgi:hypothetical protein
MVTCQDRHTLTGPEPTLAPRVRERIRAQIELLVGQPATLVDQRELIAMANRARRDRSTQQPEAFERQQELGNAVRQLWADQATADAERDEIRLVAETLDDLGGTTEGRLGVEVYDRGLLGPDLAPRFGMPDLTKALIETSRRDRALFVVDSNRPRP